MVWSGCRDTCLEATGQLLWSQFSFSTSAWLSGSNSGCQAYMGKTFTQRAISPAPTVWVFEKKKSEKM